MAERTVEKVTENVSSNPSGPPELQKEWKYLYMLGDQDDKRVPKAKKSKEFHEKKKKEIVDIEQKLEELEYQKQQIASLQINLDAKMPSRLPENSPPIYFAFFR